MTGHFPKWHEHERIGVEAHDELRLATREITTFYNLLETFCLLCSIS